MAAPKLSAVLDRICACGDALRWVRKQERAGLTPARMWATCPRGDWLRWLVREARVKHPGLRVAARECAALAMASAPVRSRSTAGPSRRREGPARRELHARRPR
jgi:hypothetical protein